MSGHSKWATTKRKKAVHDAKRGQLFTKLGKLISVAARDGGGDLSSNATLRMAIDNAKSQSMPKENIERAVLRGSGAGAGIDIESVTYEAYGPGGVAILIECLTDNKNRALSEVKMAINKAGGNFASAGSVAYNFQRKGEIIINKNKNSLSSEELEMAIIDSGAEEYETEDELILVYTNQNELHRVKTKLEELNIVIDSAELTYIPNNYLDISKEKRNQIGGLLESLDDLEDVNKVYSNANL